MSPKLKEASVTSLGNVTCRKVKIFSFTAPEKGQVHLHVRPKTKIDRDTDKREQRNEIHSHVRLTYLGIEFTVFTPVIQSVNWQTKSVEINLTVIMCLLFFSLTILSCHGCKAKWTECSWFEQKMSPSGRTVTDRHTDRRGRGGNLTEDMSKWKIVQFLFICIFYFLSFVVWERRNDFSSEGILHFPAAALTESCFVQKRVNIFICPIALWGNPGEQRAGGTGCEDPSQGPSTSATAPDLSNGTWDTRMGGTDVARCILKIMLSHWTLSFGMPFCHESCIYANEGHENGLLERAPVVPSSKIYSKGEMKWSALSFSWCTAVWRSGETLPEAALYFKSRWWLINGELNPEQTAGIQRARSYLFLFVDKTISLITFETA